MVRVRAVDQDPTARNAQLDLNVHQGPVDQVAPHHQDIAGDDGKPPVRLLFKHHGRGAKFAFLSGDPAAKDAAADDHLVRSLQRLRGGADAQSLGGLRENAAATGQAQRQQGRCKAPRSCV